MEKKRKNQHANRILKVAFITIVILIGVFFFINLKPKETESVFLEENLDSIANGIHLPTGLIDADGLQEVVTNCTTCHSSKLIIQNRMGEEQWNATIRWMQKTQGLWPLGDNQKIIVDYLIKNYPPLEKGRRVPLANIEWYELNE